MGKSFIIKVGNEYFVTTGPVISYGAGEVNEEIRQKFEEVASSDGGCSAVAVEECHHSAANYSNV